MEMDAPMSIYEITMAAIAFNDTDDKAHQEDKSALKEAGTMSETSNLFKNNSTFGNHQEQGKGSGSALTITPPSALITSPDLSIDPSKGMLVAGKGFENKSIVKNKANVMNEKQMAITDTSPGLNVPIRNYNNELSGILHPIRRVKRPKNWATVVDKGFQRNMKLNHPELLCFFESFSYLNHQELIVSSKVCKSWRNVISTNDKWKAIVMDHESTLQGHVGRITSIARIDKYIFTGSSDGKVKAWDSQTWKCAKTLNLNKYPKANETQTDQQQNQSSTYSQLTNGQTSSMNSSSSVQNQFQNPSSKFKSVSATALAAHGYALFIGLDIGEVLCQNINQMKKATESLVGHEGPINSIVIDSKRNLIITGSSDHKIGIWDLNSKTLKCFQKKHLDVVSCLAISSDYLFSGSWDKNIHVWDLNTLQYRATLGDDSFGGNRLNGSFDMDEVQFFDTPKKHTERVLSLVYHDSKLYSSSWDCFINVWSTTTFSLLSRISLNPIGICWCLAFRDIGTKRYLVGGARDNEIVMIDPQTNRVVSSSQKNRWGYKPNLHKDQVFSILSLEDGRLITGSNDWSVKVWGSRTLKKMDNVISISIIKNFQTKPTAINVAQISMKSPNVSDPCSLLKPNEIISDSYALPAYSFEHHLKQTYQGMNQTAEYSDSKRTKNL